MAKLQGAALATPAGAVLSCVVRRGERSGIDGAPTRLMPYATIHAAIA